MLILVIAFVVLICAVDFYKTHIMLSQKEKEFNLKIKKELYKNKMKSKLKYIKGGKK